jgi:succinate-semialdehyde dehydrogenase/glutarate-semialdehyde dehydrogenase
VLVEASAREEFERLVLEEAAGWTFGDPAAEGTRMGPLVSRAQRERVVAQVEDARARGARILLGGEVPDGAGAFYPATVLADAPDDALVVREETFGPVVCLEGFASEEDGVRRANDTPYGLGANVWTGDSARAARVARALRAGQVGVNRYLGGAKGTPWVGARQSGFGFLGGIEGHRQFTVPKTIATARQVS